MLNCCAGSIVRGIPQVLWMCGGHSSAAPEGVSRTVRTIGKYCLLWVITFGAYCL
jgi:hypothetical protein